MKTEELINNLAQKADEPRVQVTFGSLVRAWCLVAGLVGLTAFVFLVKERHLAHASSPLIEAVALYLGGIVVGILGIKLGFPGRAKTRPVNWIAFSIFPVLALVSLGLGAFSGIRTHPMGLSLKGCFCSAEIFAVASLPGYYLLFLVNKAAPMRALLTSICSLVSAGLLGAAVLHLACPVDDIMHLLVYHLLPVSLLVLLAIMASDRLVKKL